MTTLYIIGGFIAVIVALITGTYAADRAHKRRIGRQELRERRVEFLNEHGGPLRRMLTRFRFRRRD